VALSVWIGKEGAQLNGGRQMEKLGTCTKRQLPDKDISTYYRPHSLHNDMWRIHPGGQNSLPKCMIRQKNSYIPKKEKGTTNMYISTIGLSPNRE
jgi:hypothetical protein